MRLHAVLLTPGVTALGPGRRIGLWVEGCSLRCPGCTSPDLFERRPSSARPVSELLERIIALSPRHCGLTVSGGEPFDQATPMAALLEGVRRRTDLDVLVYSGYRREELEGGSTEQRRLLRSVDLLLDGRYEESMPTRKLWRGSDNQVLHLLSPRAAAYSALTDREHHGRRPLQVGFSKDGRLRIVGVPRRDLDAVLRRELVIRGIRLSRRRHA